MTPSRGCGLLVLVAVATWCGTRAADFADELGSNTGPVPADQEQDGSVFAKDGSTGGYDSTIQSPFRGMASHDFQVHAMQAYRRTLARLNEVDDESEKAIPASELRPADLELFWEFVFNPSGLPIEAEERDFLAARLDRLIDREGLEDPELALMPGYITRGNALHFMLETNAELYRIKDRLEQQREEERMRQEL